MEQQPEVIREQIEQTRESLSNKLESLENQVKQTIGTVEHTVESVTGTVEGAVEAVSNTMHKTYENIRDALDIPRHARRHPYAMAGGALALGVVAGWWVKRQMRPTPFAGSHAAERVAQHDGQSGKSWFAHVLTPLTDELHHLKGIGLGFLFGLARDALERSAPPNLAPKVRQIIDDMRQRAGAMVMTSPVFGRAQRDQAGEPARATNP